MDLKSLLKSALENSMDSEHWVVQGLTEWVERNADALHPADVTIAAYEYVGTIECVGVQDRCFTVVVDSQGVTELATVGQMVTHYEVRSNKFDLYNVDKWLKGETKTLVI